MTAAVFFDRDGVLIETYLREGKPYPPNSLGELKILPGIREALLQLRSAGFLNIVVTNQPDVATGKQRREVVEAMHKYLLSELPLDAIKVCYHVDKDQCACRKPKPGMLLEAAAEFGINVAASHLIGDRWRDIEAGQAAGCRCWFINCGYREKDPPPPFANVKSAPDAVHQILFEFQTRSDS